MKLHPVAVELHQFAEISGALSPAQRSARILVESDQLHPRNKLNDSKTRPSKATIRLFRNETYGGFLPNTRRSRAFK